MSSKNFIIKNGLTVGNTEVIDSSGNITASGVGAAVQEAIADKIGGIIQGSGSTTVTYDDANDIITISSTGKTEEEIQDIVGGQLVTNGSHTNITASYDDDGDGAVDLSISDSVIRGKISASGDLSYDNSTGVVSFTERTDAEVRGLVSVTDSGGDGSLAYDNSTGVITYTGPSASEVQAHITAGTGVSISSGEVSIGQAVGTSDTPSFAGITLTDDSTVTGHILPSADITYDLGSLSNQWRDVYVGPGSLYVNGQKVLEDSSGTIVVSADSDQNLQMKTAGSGDIEFNPSGTGIIQVKGTMQMLDGETITNSAGNNVEFGNNISVNQVSSRSADTNLVLSGNGTGNVTLNDSVVITGDLTVSGTTTTVNSETINLADNILNLNSDFTSGSPTQDAGLSISRGGSAAKTFLWDETNDKWSVGSETMVAGTFEGNLTGNVTGTVSSLSNHDTDDVSEGSTNLYHTTARARGSISAGGDLSYNSGTGVISFTERTDSEVQGLITGGTGVSVSSGQVSIGQAVSTSSNVEFTQITTNYANNSGGVARNIYQNTSAPTSGDGQVGDLWILYS